MSSSSSSPSLRGRAPRGRAISRLVVAVVVVVAVVAPGCNGSVRGSTTTPLSPGLIGAIPDPTKATARELHTATLLETANDVLICGGRDAGGAFLTSAELFRGVGRPFETVGSLATARARHTATLLDDGTVLVAGGGNGAGATAEAELYSPSPRTFGAASSDLLTARQNHAAVRIDTDDVIVIAGDDGGTSLASCERYVLGTGFAPAGALQRARTQHTATFLGGDDIFVAGGFAAGGGVVAEVEILDGGAGTSRILMEPLRVPRAGHAAVRLFDGRVLIAGGVNATGTVLDFVEIYDPLNERTVPVQGGLLVARARPRATSLVDARILITGGDQTGELFDPASSSFSAAGGTFMTLKLNHTATHLPGPETLFIGGLAAGTTAEVFTE